MGNKESTVTASDTQAAPLLNEAVDENQTPKMTDKPGTEMSIRGVPGGMSVEKRKALLEKSIEAMQVKLKDRRHPYRFRIVLNEDGTKAKIVLGRGNICILLATFAVGACILGIIVQRCIFPWFRWAVVAEVTPEGKLVMKFNSGKSKIVLCLTCILTSCVLAYFSNKEYVDVRKECFEAFTESANEFYSAEGLDTVAVTDNSPANLKELFLEKDDDEEDS